MTRSISLARFVSLAGFCACLFAGAGTAHAHPDLDRGKELAQELDLVPALAAFDAALSSGTLSNDELVDLLGERIFVLYGLRRRSELEADMVWLSALAPDYRLDLRAPPELIGMWTSIRDQGRGPLKLTLSAEFQHDDLIARAEASGTVPNGLTTRIYVREGVRDFRREAGPSLREKARPGARYALYAEAVGPAGIPVSSSYSEAEPLEITAPRTAPLGPATAPVDERSWAREHRGWLIGGAVLIVAAVAVTTVVLVKNRQDDHSNETTLMPMVDF